ncbi:hypothetical protein F383_18930 [Gossypium arboreum]|uniref:Uncharacterized protein n=1 Tax=Gossypium arboreum TaxID=29729 RepID=A0A0B0MFV4_GOSAR|nr:hypothetical protein F383_18930 [Gossypium arboreum]
MFTKVHVFTFHSQTWYTIQMNLNQIHIHIVIHFLRMPVEPFRINKDTRMARKAHTMPTSQTWSYM